ncbi:MAG TPA: hypothetical protein VL137_01405 [Polyangiaceae bacterium]|nr:hypothetical protein [Polyangiaceae bacterium]
MRACDRTSLLICAAAWALVPQVVGCSSPAKTNESAGSSAGGPVPSGGTTVGSGGNTTSSGGNTVMGGGGNTTAGGSAAGGQVTVSGGAPSGGGASSGGANVGGSGGVVAAGGSGGDVATGGVSQGGSPGGGAGGDPDAAGDTPPQRPLNVLAPPMQITHGNAGLDPRAAKMMGKLVVELGVDSGSYVPWLGKRGFHVIGVSFLHCNIGNNLGRDHNGDCRLNTFDGMPHGDQNAVGPADSISGKVLSTITSLDMQYPEEDWGYFLNADGSVRWSDVAFSGMSHGSSTAARIGMAVRLYRAVSRSGPRDNGCGVGQAPGDFDPNNPPWDPNCDINSISSWLDETPATPIDRFYAMVGKTDVEYGDIMFTMNRIGFRGMPERWDLPGAVLTDTNRFYVDAGHLDFLLAAPDVQPPNTEAVLNIAFGVPPENQHPNF